MKKKEIVKFEISRDEWIIILSVCGFAFIWILFIIPNIMNSNFFLGLVPPLQYFLYNIGFFLIISSIFGTPFSYVIKRRVDITGVIKGGISSSLFFIMLDLWQPPFLIAPGSGEILITNMESLVGTSFDYTLYWFYSNLLPGIRYFFVGKMSALFILIYLFTPIVISFIIALLLKPRMVKRLFRRV